jgi:curved DNA-binding protein CbpA
VGDPAGHTSPPPPPSSQRLLALRKLGLPPDADDTTIRRAFKRLAMELHPDRHSTSPEEIRARNAARFAEASAAYHLLVA